jgi:hypothetical protein
MNPPAGIILYKLKFDKNSPISAVLYWGETPSPDLVNFGTMTRKLQITNICILFLLTALFNMALAPSTQVWLSATNTPKMIKLAVTTTRMTRPKPSLTSAQPGAVTATPVKGKSTPLEGQVAGTSDWIAVIGVLIVAIIVIPILIKRKEWWGR